MEFNFYDGTSPQEIMLMKQSLKDIMDVVALPEKPVNYECPIGKTTTIDCENAKGVKLDFATGVYGIGSVTITNSNGGTASGFSMVPGNEYIIKDGFIYGGNLIISYLGKGFDSIAEIRFPVSGPEGAAPANLEVTLYK